MLHTSASPAPDQTRRARRPRQQLAAWVAPAGFSLLVVTILFLMALVIAAMVGHPVPCSGRGLVVFVLALTTGASAGFLTGSAKAEGKIPFAGGNVMTIAASGAIATIVIVLLAGFQLYANRSECADDVSTSTDHENQVARRFWQTAFAGDWKTSYEIFPPVVQQQFGFPAFIKTMSYSMSQFSAPPRSRHFERADIASGTLIVANIVAFDQVSTFRELLSFQRVAHKWAPWSAVINPVEWPQANSYRFLTAQPSQIIAAIAKLPAEQRASTVVEQYAGRYVPPPGWSFIVGSVGSKAGDRTCDVHGGDAQNEAALTLHKVLDGCSLAPGSTIQVIGRVSVVDENVHLEAVRFWK